MATDVTYPLDLTGHSPGNLITSELHTVSESNYRDYFFIVPKYAPFYVENFKIEYIVNGVVERELTEGVEFNFALMYVAGVRSVGKPLYGAITLNNLDPDAILRMQYQTLGGEWIVDRWHVLTVLAEKAYNPRTTIWDVVTNKPEIFPPIPHYQDYSQFFGQEELIASINNIANLIAAGRNEAPFVQHLVNEDIHHTVEQLRELILQTLPIAQTDEALAGTSDTTLITPYTLARVLEQIRLDVSAARGAATTALTELGLHFGDIANPHQTTKAQVLLSDVVNLPLAEDIDIENQQEVNKYITLRQAFMLARQMYGNTTFALVPSSMTLTDNSSVSVLFDSVNLTNPKSLYWTIQHIDTVDADFIAVNGMFTTASDGSASITIQSANSTGLTETRSFRLAIRLGSINGPILILSDVFTLTLTP